MKNILDTINLTKRELQCLQLSLRGRSASKVALELGISRRTVEEYLNNIKHKYGVKTKADMIDIGFSQLLNLK